MALISSAPTDPVDRFAQTITELQRRIADLERAAGRLSVAWSSYVAAFTAATTNPNIGTTGTKVAAWARLNGRSIGWRVRIAPNGTGIAVGSGLYGIELPVAPAAACIVGAGWIYNGTFTPVILDWSTGNARLISTKDGSQITHTTGMTANGHVLEVGGTYEAAS